MPDVILLPVRPLGSAQAAHLCAELAVAHTQGRDLGSRVPHIHAGGAQLLELSNALEAAINSLKQQLAHFGRSDLFADHAILQLVGVARDLADKAQRFPSGG